MLAALGGLQLAGLAATSSSEPVSSTKAAAAPWWNFCDVNAVSGVHNASVKYVNVSRTDGAKTAPRP